MVEIGEPDYLRIALLTYRGHPHVGGQGVYVRHLSKALVDLGHHVEVLSGPPYPRLDERVKLTRLPSLDIWSEPHPLRKPRLWEWKHWTDVLEHASFSVGNFSEPLAFSWRVWSKLRHRKQSFDLIHDNQTLGWGLLKLKQEGWPILTTIHHPITVDRKLELEHARGFWERLGKRRWYSFTKMQRQVARRLPQIITVSESARADIVAGYQVYPSRLQVVPVGVDPTLFAPLEMQRHRGHLVTTASADVTMKGLKFLLQAVAKLRRERHIELTIIGKRRNNSEASATMSRLGLDDCVTFVNGLTDADIVRLYSQAELAVVPSLYEGFSLPAIEAMACAIPLVATNAGALPEVAGTHNETCFMTNPGDSDALATTIREALDNETLRARVGRAGRQRVIRRWSWQHSAQRTVEQYHNLLANHRADS